MLRGRASFPGRPGLEQPPAAAAHDGVLQGPEQFLVELAQLPVGLLGGPPSQLNRQLHLAPVELAVVEEPHPRRGVGDEGRRPVLLGAEDLGSARLVVVFEEVCAAAEHFRVAAQVLAHGGGARVDQVVVEALVVGVVEPEGLQFVFQAPVGFSDEEKVRVAAPHGVDRLRPELPCGRRASLRWRNLPPGSLKDIVQHQHGHVAAHAVALSGDSEQRLDERVPQVGVAVVELGSVGPAGEVGVAAVSEDLAALRGGDGEVVVRLAGQQFLGAGDIILRVGENPVVVARRVIGDEVENQAQAALGQLAPQAGQRCRPAQAARHAVVLHGVRRAEHVVGREVRQDAPVLGLKLGVLPGQQLPRFPALPHAHQPDELEAQIGQLVQPPVGHLSEGGRPAGALGRNLPGPHPRVDFVEQRMAGRGSGRRGRSALAANLQVASSGKLCDYQQSGGRRQIASWRDL